MEAGVGVSAAVEPATLLNQLSLLFWPIIGLNPPFGTMIICD